MSEDSIRQSKNRKGIAYIVGLKGLACFMIMIGHYLSVYQSAESFGASFRVIDICMIRR